MPEYIRKGAECPRCKSKGIQPAYARDNDDPTRKMVRVGTWCFTCNHFIYPEDLE